MIINVNPILEKLAFFKLGDLHFFDYKNISKTIYKIYEFFLRIKPTQATVYSLIRSMYIFFLLIIVG